MAKSIPSKWLTETATVQTGWAYDADRNKTPTTSEICNIAITNVKRSLQDGNGGKMIADSLLLISDERATIDGKEFVPIVDMGITWKGNTYTVKEVTPFYVRGKLHHYEGVLE